MVFKAVIIPFFIGFCSAFLISRIGSRFSLIDNPNERSSHSQATPRGGGIGIWLSFILLPFLLPASLSHLKEISIVAGFVGLLSFLEDLFSLPSQIRLLLQLTLSIITVSLVFEVFNSDSYFVSSLLFSFWVIFITGTANFYNFMDGINGIAGLAGIVGFGLLAFFSYFIVNEHDIMLLSIVLAAGCIGFLPFNFPKARVFMGDVGSIFLGFVFASFVVRLSTSFNMFLCLIMFLCTFYADAVITIYYRWRRGENLMQAHRSHLYQYMSNELGMPHWQVSLMYAIIQLLFGILAILSYQKGVIFQIVVFVVFSSFFVISYQKVKRIKAKMALQ